MRAIDPHGNFVDTDQVWWWQLPDSASPAEVRQACYRNAVAEVACASKVGEVRGAITEVLAAYAWVVQREGRKAPRKRGELRVHALLDWALINRDPDVQKASDRLWREVLRHHRAEWEAEARTLMERWNDPASPLRGLRRRMQGDGEEG
ncbi:hypothetical protein [Plastoroseomonas hellenica]|uniref:hypothetical protein n=1 Tax=Plastoroseomonas hellenica TaxID=2687306 RepID=UPI001BA4FDE7|nr:hypothetical protein [Plastoroseomonas hellenica]MBR0647494.1 hypothetical protein [Plastoroseomonas hellenica]